MELNSPTETTDGGFNTAEGSSRNAEGLASPAEGSTRHNFKFTGYWGDYMGIWLVNSLFTTLTLGLYGPWAKVRKLQFFYGNTQIANGSFQFLADPKSMLLWRVLAILLFVAFFLSDSFTGVFTAASIMYAGFFLVYLLVAPILTVTMLSFRLRNSAWRNVRFRFNKDYVWAYRVYLAPNAVLLALALALYLPFSDTLNDKPENDTETALALLTHGVPADTPEENEAADGNFTVDDSYADEIAESQQFEADTGMDMEESETQGLETQGSASLSDIFFSSIERTDFIPALILAVIFILLLPYFDFIHYRFLVRNAEFGNAKVTFHATVVDYYKMYSKIAAVGLGLVAAWYLRYTIALPLILLIPGSLIYFMVLKSYFSTQRYNLVFDNLEIGEGYYVQANASVFKHFWISLTNSLGVIVSFGLLVPWAEVRMAKYFLSVTHLQSKTDLIHFLQGQSENTNAMGEELADVFDLELGL